MNGNEKDYLEEPLLGRLRSSDYLTVRGLSTVTGCDYSDFDLTIVKELLDNGLDSCEEIGGAEKKIEVVIEKDDKLNIIVRDSGLGLGKDDVKKILDFEKFYSTKHYAKLPRRGSLGNATKVIAGIPYALCREKSIDPPYEPITIKSRGEKHSVRLETDEDLRTVKAVIESHREPCEGTEVNISLPLMESYWGFRQSYLDLIRAYAIFNPSASFRLEMRVKTRNEKITENLPALGNPRVQFSGKPSPLWFSQEELCEYARAFAREESTGVLSIEDFLGRLKGFSSKKKKVKIFREIEVCEDSSLKELVSDAVKLNLLYDALCRHSRRFNPNILTQIGEENLIARRVQIYGKPKKHAYSIYKGEGITPGVPQTPFVLEVLVAVLPSYIADKREVIVGINGAPCLKNPLWRCELRWKKKNQENIAFGIYGLLEKFDIKDEDPVLVVVHITSPCIKYVNYGKSEFHVTPYREALGQTIHKAARFYYRFKRGGRRGFGEKSRARKLLVKELVDRAQLKEKLRFYPRNLWVTQHSFYYLIRKRMGGDIGIKRDTLIDAIRVECENLGYKRLDLGIIAAVRAEMFFRGKTYPVSWENIRELAKMGSDVLIIEKEGISKALELYANERGVALVTSRGFIVEYAHDLIELQNKWRANIFILSDYDASGLSIASKVPDIPRIGVDLETCIKLGIVPADAMEAYKPRKNHLGDVSSKDKAFVTHYRIEIDSILAEVGPKALWEYLENEMLEHAPVRDLTRSINLTVPMPPELVELLDKLKVHMASIAAPVKRRLFDRLRNWEGGFTDVERLGKELQEQLVSAIRENPGYQKLYSDIKKATKDILKKKRK